MPPDAPEKPPAPNPGKAETPIGSAESKRSGQAFSAEPSLPAGPGHADPLYGHIVEDQTEVISRFKADGTFTFVNDVYCRFFGKAREELVGHQWQPRAVAEDLPQIEAKLRTLDPAHPVAVIENRVYAANGEVRWMQFVNRAFFDRDGRNVETQSVGRDVTERKQAEDSLRESQALLQQLLASAPDAVFAIDRDYRLLFSNLRHQQAMQASGGPRLQIGESALSAAYPKEVLDYWRAAYDRGLRGEEFQLETEWIDVEGRQRVFENSFSPLRSAKGAVIGVQVVARDFTHRKQTELALRESEHRFMTLFRSSPVPSAITRVKDSLLQDVNDAFLRLFGFAREEVVGRTSAELGLWPEPKHREELLRRLQADGIAEGLEATLPLKSGATGTVLLSSALVNLGGEQHILTTGLDHTARKQTELALRGSRNLLRSFYDSAPFMMGVVELEGDRIIGVEANAKVAAFFERTPAQMAECDGREMNQNDSITQLWLEKYRQSQREQRSVRFEYQHPTRAGLLWLSVCVAPLLDSSTPRPRFSFVVEDVTERKRSEEALNLLNATLEQQVATRTSLLREREELLKVQYDELDHIYRTAPVGLCHLDSELRYVRINDRLAEMNGRPAAEHLGRTPLEIVPVITAQTMALMRQVLATGQPLLNVAFRGATPSAPGIQRDWISHFYPLRSEAGKCLGLSVVVVEVTELKAALAALEHSRSILADAQRIAHLGSFEYDVATGQTTWSEEQYRIYGVDPAGPSPNRDELLAKWILPDDVVHVSEIFTKAVLSRSVYELEHRIVRPDGAVRWTYNRAQPYLDEQGERCRYLGTTLDITERKRAEEAVLQYQDRLRALTQRLHSVREEESHRISRELHDELGQMLTGVKMELRLAERELESEVLTPRDAALLERVMSATELTDAMAKSVQRIALELRLALPDRLGLFAALRQEVQQFQERSGIRISLQLPENEPELSASVTTACYRICQEALTNIARHAGATEAAIELRADQRASEWVLEVRDNGRGIPSNPLGNPPSLGLLGMQERARSLGGEVRVTSGAERGTVVCLRLPRRGDRNEGP